MSHYKAPDNSLHFLDDDSFAYLLPAGAMQITDEEANAIREANKPVAVDVAPEPTKAELLQQIATLTAKVEALR